MPHTFQPLNQPGYELCLPVNPEDHDTIGHLVDGTSRVSTWKPLKMRLIRRGRAGNTLKESDCPWRGPSSALIFRSAAVTALGTIFRAHGELLPLECDGADLWMLNVTRVLPALDEAASGVEYENDGSIWWIQRYVLREDVIRGSDVFTLARRRASPTFVSRRFVDLWRSSGLRGLAFTPTQTSSRPL